MDFDNLFDEAISDADARIIETMGKNITVSINGVKTPVRAVFDEPAADVSIPNGAGMIADVAPTLFVKTAAITGLKKRDLVVVAGSSFWVIKVGPDDTGTCVVTLGRGIPNQPAPPRRGHSE